MAEQSAWQQVSGNAAEMYERGQVTSLMAPLAPRLIDAAAVQPAEHVLDVACGTGVVARLVAERVGSEGRVVGLDFNGGMLAVARSLPPVPGAAIEWVEASALAMPLPDAAFDVVLCQHGLQQFPDRLAALAEMRRVLRPGGRLAACVWGALERCPGMAAMVAALERHVSVAAANNRRAPFALSNTGEMERLVTSAGFSDVAVQTLVSPALYPSPAALVQFQLAGSPLSTMGGMTDEALAAVIEDVDSAMAAYVTDGQFTFPMEVVMVTARVC